MDECSRWGPIYRPYALLHKVESDPYSALENKNDHPSVWRDYHRIVMSHHGDVLKAAADLGARSSVTGESLYLEALGSAQCDAGVLLAARASFHDAAALAKGSQCSVPSPA